MVKIPAPGHRLTPPPLSPDQEVTSVRPGPSIHPPDPCLKEVELKTRGGISKEESNQKVSKRQDYQKRGPQSSGSTPSASSLLVTSGVVTYFGAVLGL
ncbi:hypothetical protein HPG69_012593 [Diceros bicornis minor]|uniref:Uncharacterized protein n=1 Tax=Diceros bicornis minor TaxID=77932 RepID=A0A7J7F8K2_DICBM|nr:hypothetical protein HPG69_012593 [Diceros bicornis minor]